MQAISRRSFLLFATAGLAAPRTLAAARSDLAFLVIGDWGHGSASQRKVAVQMAKIVNSIGCQFIISTGDNFYPHGVKSIDDDKWTTRFGEVYDAPALNIPWYITLGNHDHEGNISAQINYSRLSSRWRLPESFYRHTQLLTDGESADFFHLDTTSLIERYPIEDPQLAWLERKLAASTASWKFVIGHHPIFAGGEYTKELVVLLKPLLERYGVQVYLNGHDHHMEHIFLGGTHYLTSGAASKPREAQAGEGTQFVMGDKLGFLAIRMTSGVLRIEFIDSQGTSLYRRTLTQNPDLTYWSPFDGELERANL